MWFEKTTNLEKGRYKDIDKQVKIDRKVTSQTFPLQVSSITKSGRVIKKPQLMDISDEDKRQKQTREQLRQNEALMNLSLEEVREREREWLLTYHCLGTLSNIGLMV